MLVLVSMVAAFASGEPRWDQLDASSGWKEMSTRVSDVGPVKVFHKEIDGLPCLQGVLDTTVSPDKLIEVVVDIPGSLRWSSAGLSYSEVVARPSGALHFWQYLDVPNWTMVADRYWVLEGRPESYGGGKRFRWHRLEAETAYPKVAERAHATSSSAIEPPTNWGEWLFLPTAEGTEVSYRACADVGGALPQSIQTWVATRTLPDTVADVVREAQRR